MHTLTILDGINKICVNFGGTPTVQQVLEENGITMPHPCGGAGRCGKCAITIWGDISQPDERERENDCRLSCRTRLLGDAKLLWKSDVDIYAEGIETSARIEEAEEPEGVENNAGGEKKGAGRPAEKKDESADLAAAVDIGTTTVALAVYELATGKCLNSQTMLNPQSVVAADVIGRIEAAGNGKLAELQQMMVSCIQTLARRSGYEKQIQKWVITGNTTMLYLLQGENPQSLAVAPYVAEHLYGETVLFLDKPAFLPHCMHAFVGADITCAVLESGMCDWEETALLCDIGTNGEIALWKAGKLYVTSTAAGPVFEGAGISCGCQSVAGAIEAVSLQGGKLSVQTIKNVKPVGLCGSGVIDAVACLLCNSTVDETGAMEEEAAEICEGIALTREDIRTVQLAKAAIAAGIKTLLEVTNTGENEIQSFFIAGGFGSHLNLESAVRIGLFPASLKEKVMVLGNAALKGAAIMLLDENTREKAGKLAKNAECINLGGNPQFNENYIDEMFFIHSSNTSK